MQTILILGGSTDIGLSLAKSFKNLDYHVILTYYHHPIDIHGITTFKCDITSEEELDTLFKTCHTLFGKIDILLNLAAISMDNSFLNKTKAEFMQVLEVNLVGTFLANQMYSRYNDNGLIINMSSTDATYTYHAYNLDYAVSKAGVITLSKIINDISSNRVICLCPNWINSNSTNLMNQEFLDSELKRIGQTRLIEISELVEAIHKIINNNDKLTVVYRIDIKENDLWIEKES